MPIYKALFRLQLQHSYYADNKLRTMQIEPTPITLALMQQKGLFIKKFENGLWLLCDTAQIDYLQNWAIAENPALSFSLKPTAPYWLSVTDQIPEGGKSYLYFSNKLLSNETEVANPAINTAINTATNTATNTDLSANQNKNSILKSQIIEIEQDIKKIKDEEIIFFLQNQKYSHLGTSFAQLFLSEIVWNEPNFLSYNIQFVAKSTYWRYIIVPKYLQESNISLVIENEQNIAFSEVLVVENKHIGMVYQIDSLQPLTLAEVSPYHFQLKKYHRERQKTSKVLIERMPVAGKQAQKEYTEIYVYV
jgi:hypothetical protein